MERYQRRPPARICECGKQVDIREKTWQETQRCREFRPTSEADGCVLDPLVGQRNGQKSSVEEAHLGSEANPLPTAARGATRSKKCI
ncbi:unnamed protein product [Heligmosomoides polygyrus]|uniref:Uncharacterized protein n=1 Tax=Heligmosomoides polygyrus TaxID=6339 RepID=A0A183FZ33_HELPZ|nr:unnamed protein product [Heligmosomoides polygyrus]